MLAGIEWMDAIDCRNCTTAFKAWNGQKEGLAAIAAAPKIE
jgi:hypothetical protein